MLPIYLSYFAGGEAGDGLKNKRRALINALGFVLGFTIVFVLLGAAAGSFGSFIRLNQRLFEIIGGVILILFGLNFMSVINLGFLSRSIRPQMNIKSFNFPSSVLLGIVFSVGWTPCVGAFLGSALLLAANSQETLKGIIMLLLFSLGLGIPFVISALLIDSLKRSFDAIKRHYKTVSFVSGLLLIIIGILMSFGQLNVFLSLLTIR
jgi:cytochrome c-type biogenesis protein